MIEIVTPEVYFASRYQLLEMHRLRYRVFKERLGWNVRCYDGLERDEFDDLKPTYILAYNDDDDLAGTWRLLPSTGPTMVGGVFSELLEGREMPADPMLWECSRFAIDTGNGQRGSLGTLNRVTGEMFCGLIEFCLAEDIREIVTVYDVLIGKILSRVGCLPKWQSGRHKIGETTAVAGWFDATEELLQQVRACTGTDGNVINTHRWPIHHTNHVKRPELINA